MYPIVTITFNPCIDRSFETPVFREDRKLACDHLQNDPGGGGINVARAVNRLRGNALAIYPEGGMHGALLTQLLASEGIPVKAIPSDVDARENINIFERSTGRQYRFIMPGPSLADHVWDSCVESARAVNPGGYIVVSGSFPDVFPGDIFSRLKKIAKQKNARLVADVSGSALLEALRCGVHLVKPSSGELAFLVKSLGFTSLTAAEAAMEIVDRKMAEIVVVSLGANGAILATKDKSVTIPAPAVLRRSTVGAGDSMVAGILVALTRKMDLKSAAVYGVACGAAAVINPGTSLCDSHDTDMLFAQLQRTSSTNVHS